MAVWVRRRDIHHEFDAVAYQDAQPSKRPLTPEILEACQRALHVIRADGEIMSAGRATLFILERVGWGYNLLPRLLAQPPLIWFVEVGYRIIARHRPFFSRFLFKEQ